MFGNNMRKTKEVITGMTLLLAVAAGVSGCMAKGSVEKQMISYMENKYGDEFTYVRSYGSSIGQNRCYRVLESSRYPGRDVLVCLVNENGKKVFLDSYLSLKYQPLAAELMKEVCKEVWPDTPVVVEQKPGLEVLQEDMVEDISFVDYTAWRYNDDYYNVYVDTEAEEQEAKESVAYLREVLADRKMATRIYLYFGKNAEKYEWMVCLEMDGEFHYIVEEWKKGI